MKVPGLAVSITDLQQATLSSGSKTFSAQSNNIHVSIFIRNMMKQVKCELFRRSELDANKFTY